MGTVTPGTVTITFVGDQNEVLWNMAEFETDTSGTNGSGGIVQTVTNTGSAVTTLVATMAAYETASNAIYATWNVGALQTITAGSGFTILSSGQLSDSAKQHTRAQEWRYTADDTSVDITWGSAAAAGVVAVELRAKPTVASHIADTLDAHDASAVSIVDVGTYYTGTDVEAALQEIGAYMALHP
jgi:hypothetical protein